MRKDYKRLGDYIQLVDERNTALEELPLMGLSVSKEFIPSVANIIGTDLSYYKIVKKGQFACSLMQVSRDGKIPIAMLQAEKVIMSPAYPIFEVIDQQILLPEYLMMWFFRKEFDRQSAYFAVGGIRGNLPWEDFCDMQLPIPHPDKQREIVKEYNTIQNRINLNNQLIQKLEETAQAIYREWFVEFEFPITEADIERSRNGSGQELDTSTLGKPYKSSGGKMVWNEELEKEIPKGWDVGCLNDVVKNFISKRGKSKSTMNLQQLGGEFKYPVISAMNINNGKIVKHDTIPFVNAIEYDEWMNPKLEVGDVLLTSEAPLGETFYLAINSDYALSQRLFALRTKKEKISGWFLYMWLNSPIAKQDLEGRSSGTTVFGIKLSELKKISILIPDKTIEQQFYQRTLALPKLIEMKNQENQKLSELKDLLLSKLATVSD